MKTKFDDAGRLDVTEVSFAAALPAQARSGLLGWIACTVNGSLRVDGISLRRTLEDRLALSFPARRDGTGREHFYLRPLDDRARRDLERQVFQALGLEASP